MTPLSSKSLTQMVKSVVYKLRSSFRRGLPEANIRFMLFSSFSFCPWPQGPAFYDSAGFFVLRGPARHAKGASHPGCSSQRLLRSRLHPAGRCPNNSSLLPPLAAVVVVAPIGRAVTEGD